jgi:hypothetical protein
MEFARKVLPILRSSRLHQEGKFVSEIEFVTRQHNRCVLAPRQQRIYRNSI